MRALEKLSNHLESQLEAIRDSKENGQKVVGYYPGGFLPEELIIAAGAIPIGLVQGNRPEMLDIAASFICRWMDPFCRTQIGLAVSGTDPVYNLLDLLAIPITDNHVRAVSDVIDANTELSVFPFGVPHMKEPAGREYYRQGLSRFKSGLEELTEQSIADRGIKEAIELCNRERSLFSAINRQRKFEPLQLSSRDFITLCHASFLAEKTVMIDILESIMTEMETNVIKPAKPRILLTGSTLARDDSLVTGLIETHGGTVVIEAFDEGLRPCGREIRLDGDPLDALADGYFMDPVCPAWFRPADERSRHLIELAKEYHVDGVIWYHLMFRESFKTESYHFPDRLRKETGLSTLLVESDCEPTEAGNIATRIETFLQILGG